MSSGYNWLKFIHVASITGWFGGVAGIAILNILATRNPEAKEVTMFLRYGRALGGTLAGPAAGLALLSGIAATLVGHLSMPLWINWGFGATVVFILIGVAALRPTLNRLVAAAEAGASPDELRGLLQHQRRLLALNLLVLLSAMWAMVFKPA
jgi:uncharacterized membrane protein